MNPAADSAASDISAPAAAPPNAAPANPRRIASLLSAHRVELGRGYMNSVADWDKYARDIQAAGDDLPAYIAREFNVLADYLALWFSTGDPAYESLYVGEKVKQAYWDAESSVAQQHDRRSLILCRDRDFLIQFLTPRLPAADLAAVDQRLAAIESVVTATARKTLEILFIGDCLHLDVMAFLVGPALQDSIGINPTFLTSKNPADLRAAARKLSDRKFDLIFYSPFTYEFAPEIARLFEWRQAASGRARIAALADSALENVKATLDVLSDAFECNIFVHNAANVRRHDSKPVELGKNLLTRRPRRLARDRVNRGLADYVGRRNASTFDHLFVVDELELLARHGETALGRLFYDSELQHPAAMGKWIAQTYRDILAVHAQLIKKKLVVCDLDNTLWKGVIGEGAVEHYADKQQILKKLMAKGIVLAINSKNDPKNIRWDGAVLGAGDFVCAQINWENKVGNLKRIAQTLNLKSKDFVFIDDRADEREMVNVSMPEVLTLDALADRSWRLLDLWSQFLPSQGETDRTQFYKQKEQRDTFINTVADEAQDQGALFAKLGITVTVREARKADLKRVAELINRTNQFNTCGSRTSVREVTDWHAAGDRKIFVVDCGDKFGSMGTICIAIVHLKPEQIEIPIFVLSCRVFGYGIENVVVNVVKRLAESRGLPVIAPFKETPHNEPCRKVYPENGFTWNGSAWAYAGPGVINDPTWLTIRFESQQ